MAKVDCINSVNSCDNHAASIKEYVDDLCVKATQQISNENVSLDEVPLPVKTSAKFNADDIKETCDTKPTSNECQDDNDPSNNPSLEEEDDDGWIKVLGHDQLKKRVIREGVDEQRPLKGCHVKIRYTIRSDDTPQRILVPTETVSFILGEGDVVNALDLTVSLMSEGEVCETFTSSKYAYGALGNGSSIGADASLFYEIELLKWRSSAEVVENTSFEDLLTLVDFKRLRGNFLYNQKENQSAINSYTTAIEFIDVIIGRPVVSNNPDDVSKLNDEKLKCYNNMAAAQLKIDAFDVAISSCDNALKISPLNMKALFRKAKCYASKGQIELAIQHLKHCLEINPESKLIHSELSKYNNQYKEECSEAKKVYKKMMGNVPDHPTPTKKTSKSYNNYSNTKIIAVVSMVIALFAVLLSLLYARD